MGRTPRFLPVPSSFQKVAPVKFQLMLTLRGRLILDVQGVGANPANRPAPYSRDGLQMVLAPDLDHGVINEDVDESHRVVLTDAEVPTCFPRTTASGRMRHVTTDRKRPKLQ